LYFAKVARVLRYVEITSCAAVSIACSIPRARSVIGDCGSQKIRFREVPFRERGSRVSSHSLEHVADVDRA